MDANSFRMSAIVILGAILSASCATTTHDEPGYLTPVQLNRSSNQYHETRVVVRGWMISEFENYSLWQNRDAHGRGDFATDCVSLMIPVSMDTTDYNRRYVELDALFLAALPKNVIHLGGCNITVLQVNPDVQPIVVRRSASQQP